MLYILLYMSSHLARIISFLLLFSLFIPRFNNRVCLITYMAMKMFRIKYAFFVIGVSYFLLSVFRNYDFFCIQYGFLARCSSLINAGI